MNDPNAMAPITADCLVQDVVEQHPEIIPIFARHGLQCVGCYISPFHTIADSAREYAMALEPLLNELNHTIATPIRTRDHRPLVRPR
jgi:hybrid cluster-associated redox disulfide protein